MNVDFTSEDSYPVLKRKMKQLQYCTLSQEDRITYKLMLEVIEVLRTGSCWCGVGIGNPMFEGKHSAQCDRAREAHEMLLKRLGGEGERTDGGCSV